MIVSLTAAPVTRRNAPTAVVVLSFCLLSTANAGAVATFPAEIQKHLALSYTPPCTLCHDNPNGGIGTATTKFAVSMKAAGLSATSSLADLDKALDTLAANNTDSNGDGIPDIQELKEGIDPNTGAAQPNAPPETFGCGARIASGKVQFRGTLLGALAVLGLVVLTRRRAGLSERAQKQVVNRAPTLVRQALRADPSK